MALLLSACASSQFRGQDYESSETEDKVDKHGTFPAVHRATFEHVNLLELIDPSFKAKETYSDAWKEAERLNQFGVKYDLALNWFRSTADHSPQEKALIRNGVQERMLSVSTSRCNVFKSYLRRKQSERNFIFGSGATLSGVLGALATGATASRNLAGAAGLFSGVQAEYNQAYYSNLTAHLIVRGIESRQTTVYERIRRDGQAKPINEYSMEAAIRDAVYWDGLCATVVGLDEASESIRLVHNPGNEAAVRTMISVRAAHELAHKPLSELLADPRQFEQLRTLAAATVPGMPLAAQPDTAGGGSFASVTAIRSNLDGTRLDLEIEARSVAAQLLRVYSARLNTLTKDMSDADKTASLKDRPGDAQLAAQIVSTVNNKLIAPLALDKCIAAVADLSAATVKAEVVLQAAKPGTREQIDARTDYEKAMANADAFRRQLGALTALVRLDITAGGDKQATAWQIAKLVDLIKPVGALFADTFVPLATKDSITKTGGSTKCPVVAN